MGARLGASPQHITTPECQFKKLLLPKDGSLEFRSKKEARKVLEAILAHFRFRIWGINIDAEPFLDQYAPSDRRSMLEALIREYAYQKHGKEDPSIWFDHDPRSGHYFEKLLELFPDARFIHIIRDGRGVYASIKDLDWGPNTPFVAAQFWIRHLEKAAQVENELGSKRAVRVFYEALLKEPEKEIQRLCKWAKLSFSKEMLDGKGLILPEYTRSQHQHVDKTPLSLKDQDWRSRLPEREVEIFESHAKSKLEELGYYPAFHSPRSMGSLEKAWYRNKESFLKKWNQRSMQKRKQRGLQKEKN